MDEIAVLIDERKLVGLVVPSRSLREEADERSRESAIRAALSTCANRLPRYMQLAGFVSTATALPRTELGKLRRHLLPGLYRAARAEVQRSTAEPALSSADRALLAEPAGRAIWSWLRARFPKQRLSLDLSPQLDLGIDSLGWITLTMSIERELGITLDERMLARVTTLRALVEAAVAARPAPSISPMAPTRLASPTTLARGVHFLGHMVNRALIRLSFPLTVEGVMHLPERGPYVLCANHSSYLDAPVLAAALPWFVLRQLYWAGSVDVMFSTAPRRLFSRFARVLPIDPVRGARAGLAISAMVLQRGQVLAWFPEGWRTSDGTLQPFLPGIGAVMLRARVPIVPVYITGTFAAWPAQHRLPRRGPITVRFGPPLDPQQWGSLAQRENPEESIAAAIKAAVAGLADRQAGAL